MQFVNDDMDDLYRQAAEDYPLKTDSGDWNKVLEKMQAGGEGKIPVKRDRSKYLLLLALIPLVLICTTYIKNDSFNDAPNTPLKNKTSIENQPLSPADREQSTSTAYKKILEITGRETNSQTQDPSHITDLVTEKYSERISNSKQPDNADNKIIDSEAPVINKLDDGSGKPNVTQDLMTNNTSKPIKNANDPVVNTDPVITPAIAEQKPSDPGNNKNVVDDKSNVVDDKLKDTQAITVTEKKKQKNDKKPKNKFYAGFLGGPDFSMVKSTNIQGTGYSIGLLAGYNISKKFAVESGVLWDRKRYFAEGKHFKTDKLNWQHVTIYDLSSYCDMFEIPLNIRYNASVNSKRTWFVNAGLSSYLMKKENYDYYYERYGVYQRGSKEYKNTT